jgi:Mlc titration factor MtfA (ptsG expression regulator)
MDSLRFIIPAIAILYILIRVFKSGIISRFRRIGCEASFEDDKAQILRELLLKNFIVYKLLGEKGRRQFEKRVCRFIRMKNFRAGNNMQEITAEMRIMVAASAIQITYGYPDVYFKHFETIILFADDYYSKITGLYHEGEVNAGGAIVLSWRSFLSGFSDRTDGKNLALHEMAHALRLTNIVDNEEYDFIDRQTMHDFDDQALIEIDKIKNGENSFFRSYGSSNREEFFSVSVECFFEQPHEFRTYNPILYLLLAQILKLDLLSFDENFRL